MGPHLTEDQLVAWLGRTLDPTSLSELHAHVDACAECRVLLVSTVKAHSVPRVVAPDATALGTGHTLGRYVVLSRLGAGSSGTVYEAWDPSLDRRVALKVMPDDGGLYLQEAKALARVAHAGAVTVHDVGLADGCVFIAMELLEGGTLHAWLTTAPSWPEVLARFIEAGRGLALAHDSGIVHRDFKPANVLLGRDGKARVADFGLARVWAAPGTPLSLELTLALPRTKQLVGTPAYLAPEVIRGESASVASDQFSFCVALFEALYGMRPFAGETLGAVLDEVNAGRLRGPTAGAPRRLHAVLARGLAREPSQRWPTMASLLDALARAAAPRWRRRAVAVAGLAVVGGLLALLWPRPPCTGLEVPLQSVWNPARRQTFSDAFSKVGRRWAPGVSARSVAALDGWAQAWLTMRTSACEASRVRGEQTEAVMTLRMACLDRRLAEVDGVVSQLSGSSDESALSRAPVAIASLTPLSGCADVEALSAPVPPPTDPALRGRAQALLADIARAQSFITTGAFQAGTTTAAQLVTSAEAVGWRPAQARALLLRGELEEKLGADSAEPTLASATLAATAGRDDEAAMTALTVRVFNAAKRSKFDDAYRLAAEAQALLERNNAPWPVLMRFESALGVLSDRAGKTPEALAHHRKALEVSEKAYGADSAPVGTALNNLGAALVAAEKYEEAATVLRKAVAVRERVLDPAHPDVASSLANLGSALDGLGQAEESIAIQRRALAALEVALGSEHPKVVSALTNLALVLSDGDVTAKTEALGLLERAASIEQRKNGQSQTLCVIWMAAAGLHGAAGQHAEEEKAAQHALEAAEASVGPRHLDYGRSLVALGKAAEGLGAPERALAQYRHALDVEEGTLDPKDPRLGFPLTGIGSALLSLGRPREAVAPLERATGVMTADEPDPNALGEAQLLLARAWRKNGDEKRAKALALQALRGAPEGAPVHAPLVEFLGR